MSRFFAVQASGLAGCLLAAYVAIGTNSVTFGAPYIPAQPTPNEIEEMSQLGRMSRDESLATMRRLDPAKKARWANIFRRFDPERNWRDEQNLETDWTRLLSLGDPIAGRYLVEQYKKFPNEELIHMLMDWCSPEAVPALMEHVQSDARPAIYGTTLRGESVVGTEILSINIGRANYLPTEVQAWGRGVYGDFMSYHENEKRRLEAKWEAEKRTQFTGWEGLYERALGFRRRLMIDWWNANREPFLAGRYNEVRPGGSMPPSAATKPPAEHLKVNDSAPPEPPQLTTQVDAKKPGATEAESGMPWHWLLVAGMAALLSGVALWVFRSRRSP